MKRLYKRLDTWSKSPSQGQYAVFLGISGGCGVLLAGQLIGEELLLLQALTMAVVMFGLEYVFGLHQSG